MTTGLPRHAPSSVTAGTPPVPVALSSTSARALGSRPSSRHRSRDVRETLRIRTGVMERRGAHRRPERGPAERPGRSGRGRAPGSRRAAPGHAGHTRRMATAARADGTDSLRHHGRPASTRVWSSLRESAGLTVATVDRAAGARDHVPQRLLSASVMTPAGSVEVHVFHAPAGVGSGWGKVEALEALRRRLSQPATSPRIVCGDFNAPQAEPPGRPFESRSRRMAHGPCCTRRRGGSPPGWRSRKPAGHGTQNAGTTPNAASCAPSRLGLVDVSRALHPRRRRLLGLAGWRQGRSRVASTTCSCRRRSRRSRCATDMSGANLVTPAID